MFIKATGDKSAEMVTDEGAIYVTSNKGYNWKAAIQETVSATLNRFGSLPSLWFIIGNWRHHLSCPHSIEIKE